jgi:hypothetical protein
LRSGLQRLKSDDRGKNSCTNPDHFFSSVFFVAPLVLAGSDAS